MSKRLILNVNLEDILTANSCSQLVIEFVKYISYQRQQIPFPFKQLDAILSRKASVDVISKLPEQASTNKIKSAKSVMIDREYAKVKSIFEAMQSTFQDLEEEVCVLHEQVVEVVVILGATPLSPRDVYRLQFPYVHHGHLASKHPHQRHLLQFFRCLVQSEDLHTMFSASSAPTNLFIFIQKKGNNAVTSGFVPKEHYSIPNSGKHCLIKFSAPAVARECICGGINIHKDEPCSQYNQHEKEDDCTPEEFWFQAQRALKGFKDVKINGASISNIWLQS